MIPLSRTPPLPAAAAAAAVERNREEERNPELLRDTGVRDYRVRSSTRCHQSWYHFLSLYFSII